MADEQFVFQVHAALAFVIQHLDELGQAVDELEYYVEVPESKPELQQAIEYLRAQYEGLRADSDPYVKALRQVVEGISEMTEDE